MPPSSRQTFASRRAAPSLTERPVAAVVLREGSQATQEELREYLAPRFARFWLPDAVVFVQEIPRTATGKFLKTAIRESLAGFELPDAAGGGDSPGG